MRWNSLQLFKLDSQVGYQKSSEQNWGHSRDVFATCFFQLCCFRSFLHNPLLVGVKSIVWTLLYHILHFIMAFSLGHNVQTGLISEDSAVTNAVCGGNIQL